MGLRSLCSDIPGALRSSGLIPYTAQFAAYLGAAEAYRIGGDALAPSVNEFVHLNADNLAALRRDDPQQFFALNHLAFGASSTLDALFLLKGVAENADITVAARQQAIQSAANNLAAELFSADTTVVSGIGGGRLGAIKAAFAYATQGMTSDEKFAIAGQLAKYANAHADRVSASVDNARLVVGIAIGAAVAAEAAPAAIACLANAICRTELSIIAAEGAAGDALGPTTLAVLPATGVLVMRKGDQIVGAIDQATGLAKNGIELTALTRQAEVAGIFKPGVFEAITIDGRLFYHDASTGGAKVFTGATEAQIVRYFEDLTGQALPVPVPLTINGQTGIRYTVNVNGQNFTLRNVSRSSEQSGALWTIDVPAALVGKTGRGPEIKFK